MAETIFIKGTLNFFGKFNVKQESKFDKGMKVRFSLKDYQIREEDKKILADNFAEQKDAFIPSWWKKLDTKEPEKYINFKSLYEIPVEDLKQQRVDDEDVLPNSEVTLKCSVKDGAVYPNAMRIDKKGEMYNAFAGV